MKMLRRKLRQETRLSAEEGFPVVRGTHYLQGLPREFAPFVSICRSADDFRAAVAAIRSETPAQIAARLAFAREIRDVHSLRHRAGQLLSVIDAYAESQKGS